MNFKFILYAKQKMEQIKYKIKKLYSYISPF